jgi:hypothetical protein
MTVKKTIRLLGVSLTLVVLLIFTTGVVGDWNHQSAKDGVNCPYCHLGHQTPARFAVAPFVSLRKSVAPLALPEEIVQATGAVISQTAPRAPPV